MLAFGVVDGRQQYVINANQMTISVVVVSYHWCIA